MTNDRAGTTNKVSSRALLALGFGFTLCLSPACKDQQKCDDALKTSRQSMQDEFLDMDLARKWRDFAGKVCGTGPELTALDKEIVDREAALVKAAADKAKSEEDAGKAAVDAAGKLWKAFDQLEEKDRNEAALKKAKSKANKLIVGLAPAYAEQLQKYNESALKKREDRLPKAP